MAKSNGHTASMNRSFISSWIKTALPTISTYSMTSFASGRTTTTTIDRTEPSMGRPHTSGSWQKPLPVCHLRLETLQPRSDALDALAETLKDLLDRRRSIGRDVLVIAVDGPMILCEPRRNGRRSVRASRGQACAAQRLRPGSARFVRRRRRAGQISAHGQRWIELAQLGEALVRFVIES